MTRDRITRALREAGVVALLAGTVRAQDIDDVLARAMRDELARSMKELHLSSLERPYFIAYRVSEVELLTTGASDGSLLNTNTFRRRMLGVEVRVGDYSFDNSNFMGGPTTIFVGGFDDTEPSLGGNELPLDNDYAEIRRKIWLATDAAYKVAVERLAEKRAALLNRARDSLPDFSKESPTRTVESRTAPAVRRADAEALVRELSRVRGASDMSSMSVDVSVATTRTRYINTEGTSYTTSRPLVSLTALASTKAADGTPLDASVRHFARAFDSLPAKDRLAREIRLLALQLDSLRDAPLLDRYAGPVLFEGRAAAELMAGTFAPALLARRTGAARPEMEMFMRMTGRGGGGSFGDKLGARVMPAFLSIVDDPTVSTHDGRALFGGYTVDDEGVPGRRKGVVEAGVLRSLLSTRTPVEGMPRSTGNSRGATPTPSNLIVSSSGGISERALRDRLIALAKRRGLPHGIIVRELGEAHSPMDEGPMEMFATMRGGGDPGRHVLRAYRVHADGREELLRVGRLTGLDAVAFKDIVAASRTTAVHHAEPDPGFDFPMWLGFGFTPFSQPVASYVVPSLLFEDVAIARPARETPTPPLIPPPARAP